MFTAAECAARLDCFRLLGGGYFRDWQREFSIPDGWVVPSAQPVAAALVDRPFDQSERDLCERKGRGEDKQGFIAKLDSGYQDWNQDD